MSDIVIGNLDVGGFWGESCPFLVNVGCFFSRVKGLST